MAPPSWVEVIYVILLYGVSRQTCSQVLTVRVQVQVQVLASQVQVQVQVLASQVQVQVQVLTFESKSKSKSGIQCPNQCFW